VRWFHRKDEFENPVRLDIRLKKFSGRVAVLKDSNEIGSGCENSDQARGYLYIVETVLGRSKRTGRYVPDSVPREVLEMNLVVLNDGRFGEYIQAEYSEEQAFAELVEGNFFLYGTRYDLQWIKEQDAEEILDKFFRDSATGDR
jgi:hypothetical protein